MLSATLHISVIQLGHGLVSYGKDRSMARITHNCTTPLQLRPSTSREAMSTLPAPSAAGAIASHGTRQDRKGSTSDGSPASDERVASTV